MRLTHRHIEVFNAVMTAGTVTKAAEMLYTSQPTVSRELARIEQITGLCLFERVNRRLKPSKSAYVLFEEVKRSYLGLEHIHSLVDSMREHSSGQISLITIPDFAQSLLPGVCSRFSKSAADIGISIAVQESPFLEQCLTAQQFDLGLTESEHTSPGTTVKQLLNINEVCILPNDHPLLEKQVINIEDFAGEAVISLSPNDPYRILIDKEFNKKGVKYKQVVETATAISLCSFVKKGMGIAIVNPLTALEQTGDNLHIRPLAFSCPFIINVVTPLYRPSNLLLKGFIQALEDEAAKIKEQLSTCFATKA